MKYEWRKKKQDWMTWDENGEVEYFSTYRSYEPVPETMTEFIQTVETNSCLKIESIKFFHDDIEMEFCEQKDTGEKGWYDFVDKKFISDKEMYDYYNKPKEKIEWRIEWN